MTPEASPWEREAGFGATSVAGVVAASAQDPAPRKGLLTAPYTSAPSVQPERSGPWTTWPESSPPGISGNRCSIMPAT